MPIYRYESYESLNQNFYPTQGTYESYSQFACRVGGVRSRSAELGTFLRQMSDTSSRSSEGPTYAFAEHVDSASAAQGNAYSSCNDQIYGQRYSFPMRPDIAKERNNHSSQPVIEPPEGQSRERGADVPEKKSIMQRVLTLIPCIKVKA